MGSLKRLATEKWEEVWGLTRIEAHIPDLDLARNDNNLYRLEVIKTRVTFRLKLDCCELD